MKWNLQVLGINAAVPLRGRHPTAQLLDVGHELLLIDCGEGTQMQMSEYHVRRSRIRHIFISHLHGDHVYGLPGLITSYNLRRRKEPLHIYGPHGIQAFIQATLHATHLSLQFDLNIAEHSSEISSTICVLPHVKVVTIPLIHRVPTTGYLFSEQTSRRSIDPEALKKFGVPLRMCKALQEGEDWVNEDGQLIANEHLTTAGRKGLKYAYCSDTAYCRAVIPFVNQADLLYHESTFLDDLKEKASKRGHSTAKQAATIARDAEVSELLLGHFSSRYKDLAEFEKEAKTVFSNTQIAQEGYTYNIAP